jgi:hypothetical protein
MDRVRRRGLTAILVLGALAAPAAAHAVDYAPVDRPGPALSVAQDKLDASLACSGGLSGVGRAPVLLVPPTSVEPQTSYSWNWEPALDKLGIPWCAVTVPEKTLGDIQVAGEYVVHAVRTMHARAGRQIAIIGHSQGGMLPRWALRFWPDTRAMVDDVIGFAASNHGSTAGPDPACTPQCPAAHYQQHAGSNFNGALNSGQETFPGISYTEVYTHNDEVVTPNADDNGSSSVHGGGGEITNVALQDICPLDLSEHFAIGTTDAVAYALAIDALSHPGPASEQTVLGMAPALCLQPFQPGVNPLTVAVDEAVAAAALLSDYAAAARPAAEPPLRCYVFAAGCPAQSATTVAAKPKKKCRKRKRGKRAHHARKRCKHKKAKCCAHKRHGKHRA